MEVSKECTKSNDDKCTICNGDMIYISDNIKTCPKCQSLWKIVWKK